MVYEYKGLSVVNAVGDGGILVIEDFKEMADRAAEVYQTNKAPTISDDSEGNAGNGKFHVWSKWRNTNDDNVWFCLDPTPNNAVWIAVTSDSAGVGSIAGVSNPGGDVDFVEGTNIKIVPDNALKRIIFSLDTTSNIYFPSDNVGVVFGLTDDAKISWDGSDLVINPEVSSPGGVITVDATNYEDNLSNDNDIPNKKYIDDLLAPKFQVCTVDQTNTPFPATVSQSRKTVFTNEGTSVESVINLPSLSGNNGVAYKFFCEDLNGMKIMPASGEYIQLGSIKSKSSGYASSTDIGSALSIVGLSQSIWYASSVIGSWDVETS